MSRKLAFFLALTVAAAMPAMGNSAIAGGPAAKATAVQSNPHLIAAAMKGSPGGGAGFTCEGLQCTCQGDVDCNDMFGSGKCGDITSCDNDTGICRCMILKKTPVKKFHPETSGKVPLLKTQ
jgi:hypothetical protein